MGEGHDFEEEVNDLLDGQLQPGSGNQPFKKLDIDKQEFIVSCKWTSKASIRVDAPMLSDALLASLGPGGTGQVPLWVLGIEGAQMPPLALLRLTDLIALLEAEVKVFTPSKSTTKIAEASMPQLFKTQKKEDAPS